MVESLVRVGLPYKLVIPDQQTAIHQPSQQSAHSVVAAVVKATSDMKQEVAAVVVVLDMTVQMQRLVRVRALEHLDKETMEQRLLIPVMAGVLVVAERDLLGRTQF
jgi:hypothetical protein